jgi:hypothetical protein
MLPIKKKTKVSENKKGGIQETKWKDPCPRRQKNHLRGLTTRGTQVPKPPPVSRSISNKEGGDNEKG